MKLIDFGTAWVRGQEKNRIQGTPQFIAPEQATEKTVNEKTDIYNLGATMYRMFTGRFPQAGILKPGDDRKLVPPIKINARIPGTLNELIIGSLSLDPAKRPAGMFEIRDQMNAVAKHMGPGRSRPPRGRRGRLRIASCIHVLDFRLKDKWKTHRGRLTCSLIASQKDPEGASPITRP